MRLSQFRHRVRDSFFRLRLAWARSFREPWVSDVASELLTVYDRFPVLGFHVAFLLLPRSLLYL